jgi:uridine kinase
VLTENFAIVPILYVESVKDKINTMSKASDKKTYIIAIDGRAASGKTMLAESLSEALGASIIHLDDFFLPSEMRTEERLSEPGGNVHYERFKREIIDKLQSRDDIVYRRFDCTSMSFGETKRISRTPVIIIEGSYAHHPYFGDYANLKIFKSVNAVEQMERIMLRNGCLHGQIFKDKWIPMEEKYFNTFQIIEKADISI